MLNNHRNINIDLQKVINDSLIKRERSICSLKLLILFLYVVLLALNSRILFYVEIFISVGEIILTVIKHQFVWFTSNKIFLCMGIIDFENEATSFLRYFGCCAYNDILKPSLLRPVLFLLHANNISNNLIQGMVRQFADDTSVILSAVSKLKLCRSNNSTCFNPDWTAHVLQYVE